MNLEDPCVNSSERSPQQEVGAGVVSLAGRESTRDLKRRTS
jgi:hypothetical protein